MLEYIVSIVSISLVSLVLMGLMGLRVSIRVTSLVYIYIYIYIYICVCVCAFLVSKHQIILENLLHIQSLCISDYNFVHYEFWFAC